MLGNSIKQRQQEGTAQYWQKKRAPERKVFLHLQKSDFWNILEDIDRQIITFYYCLDLTDDKVRTIKEVAEMLSIPIFSVRDRMDRVRRILRKSNYDISFADSLEDSKAVFGEKTTPQEIASSPFVFHSHRWEELEIAEELLQKHLQKNSDSGWLIKEGLIPARICVSALNEKEKSPS